jgi:hypothetical protein
MNAKQISEQDLRLQRLDENVGNYTDSPLWKQHRLVYGWWPRAAVRAAAAAMAHEGRMLEGR